MSPVTCQPAGASRVSRASMTGSRPSLRSVAVAGSVLAGTTMLRSDPAVTGTVGAVRSVAGAMPLPPVETR